MDLGQDPRPLAGRWLLDRRLVDHARGESGCFHGELLITAAGDGLEWVESGTLRWGGREIPATRRLLLRPGPEGWQMAFADGRPFHPWRPGEQVQHPCGADLYRGLVCATPTRMRVTWWVTGPTKDQEIHSRLRRA
jgi:hypothetical protein